jgi:hypothetical protein
MNKHSRNPVPASYEGDFHRWAAEQGRLLRERRIDLVDFENVAEEIETLGRTERREVESRLAVVVLHLLKWQFQPQKRQGGWQASIRIQRLDLKDLLSENPSLKNLPKVALQRCYQRAVLQAAEETGLDFEAFPEGCPYSVEQVLDDGFLPA